MGADLIVMGSRGRSRLADAVLGSVAGSAVHHASCPVLVTREKADPQTPDSADLVAAEAGTYGPEVSDFDVEDLAETRPRGRPSPATAWHHQPANRSCPHIAEVLAAHGPAPSAARAAAGRGWPGTGPSSQQPGRRCRCPLASNWGFALAQRATWLPMARRLGLVDGSCDRRNWAPTSREEPLR
jgi:hypothetical protein